MPLKSEKQIEEVIEILQWKIDTYPPCSCANCAVDRALFLATRDGLLLALGKEPKDLTRMIRALKRRHSRETKHQCAHAE